MATPTPAPKRGFDLRALRRLAIWGASAAVALAVAVLVGFSDIGARRLAAATSAGTLSEAEKALSAQLLARSAETETETRRLRESIRILATDRERLVARIALLERSVEDLTGSIKRQAANPPPPAQSEAAPPVPGAPPPAIAPAAVREAAVSPATPEPQQPARPAADETAAPGAGNEGPPKGELGVDIGGAVSFDGLRALWASVTKGGNAGLFDGLHPVVAVRENSRSRTPELRLIAGPTENAEAAAKICAALSAARRYCHPAPFEGQNLPPAEPAPERKPQAAPKSAGSAASKTAAPAQPQTRAVWPFR